MFSEKIAAVIVTYNRKDLLKECLNALMKQTRHLQLIIIMDNASSDGTYEMLKREFLDKHYFDYINLGKNLGAAGGFYYGIKHAYEKGFDWIWVMDDDTTPLNNALEELVKGKKIISSKKVEIGFLTSNSRWINRTQCLLTKPTLKRYWGEVEEFLDKGYIEVIDCPFVSMFINRRAIEKCGYPIKEFFIWGEDVEFSFRITQNSFKNYFITSSKVIHKSKKNESADSENITRGTEYKHRYFTRNRTFLIKKTKNIALLLFLIYDGVELLFSKKYKFFFSSFLPSFVKGLFFSPKIKFPKK